MHVLHDPDFATDECPATQPLQTVALEAANVPALQSPHTEAALEEKCPAPQSKHTDAEAAAYCPALHVTHDAAPAEDDDPAVQPTQSALVCPPLFAFAVPAEHSIHVAADVAFVALLYFPELHSLQTDADEREYVPAPQS